MVPQTPLSVWSQQCVSSFQQVDHLSQIRFISTLINLRNENAYWQRYDKRYDYPRCVNKAFIYDPGSVCTSELRISSWHYPSTSIVHTKTNLVHKKKRVKNSYAAFVHEGKFVSCKRLFLLQLSRNKHLER